MAALPFQANYRTWSIDFAQPTNIIWCTQNAKWFCWFLIVNFYTIAIAIFHFLLLLLLVKKFFASFLYCFFARLFSKLLIQWMRDRDKFSFTFCQHLQKQERAITLEIAIKNRCHEPMYKTYTKKTSKEINSNKYWYCNIRRAIIIFGVIEKYWKILK